MKKSQLKEAIKNEIKSVLSEEMTDKEREDKLQQAKRGGGKEKPLRKLAAIGKKEDSLNEISSTEANAQLMEIVEHQKQILNILKELKKGADLDAAIRIIENEVGKTLTKVKNLEQIKGLQTTFADIREGTWGTGTVMQIQRFLRELDNLKLNYYDIVGSDDVFNGLDQAEMAAKEMMMNAPENRSDITEDEEPTSAEVKKEKSIAAEKETALKAQKALKDLKSKMKKKAKEYKEAEGDAKEKIKAELKKMTAEKKKLEKDT